MNTTANTNTDTVQVATTSSSQTGMGRLAYVVTMVVIFVLSAGLPSLVIVTGPASLLFAMSRIKDIGYSGWWALLPIGTFLAHFISTMFVPTDWMGGCLWLGTVAIFLSGHVVGVACVSLPTDFRATKKLDAWAWVG
jgi:hypothetical protein